MQQADVMPTTLGLLDYDLPYVAFGNDLTATSPERTFAVNSNNGIYQLFKDGYLLQYDGTDPIALYAYDADPMLQDNLLGKVHHTAYLQLLQSVIQQYMERMTDKNGLVVTK